MVSSPAGIPKTAEPVKIIPPNNKLVVVGSFKIMNKIGRGKTSSWAPSPTKVHPRIFFGDSNFFSFRKITGNNINIEKINIIYGSVICESGENRIGMVKRTSMITSPIVRAKPHANATIVFFVIFMSLIFLYMDIHLVKWYLYSFFPEPPEHLP